MTGDTGWEVVSVAGGASTAALLSGGCTEHIVVPIAVILGVIARLALDAIVTSRDIPARRSGGTIQTHQTEVAVSSKTSNDIIGRIYDTGAQPVKWEGVGQTVEGTVVALRERQLADYNTGEPETWRDGSPKLTPILTVEDIEGEAWDIYLRTGLFTAFRAALREAFPSGAPTADMLVGAVVVVRFADRVPGERANTWRHVYAVDITPRSA